MSRRIFLRTLLAIIVAVFGLLSLSGDLYAQGRSDEAFDRVAEVQDRHTDALMARPGVVGTAIGLGQGARPVLLVLLQYGGVPGIPENLEAVPVRVMVTGTIYARGDMTSKYRPAPIGASTGHPDITAGTIGCRVTDGTNVYALSNNHVYANENRANIGDNVLQPGPYDGGENPGDAIGTLYDYEPINFRGNARNKMDAAIALSSTSELDNATLSDGYGVPSKETIQPYVNLAVQKYGRTTELTTGYVSAVNATVRVRYDSGQAVFSEQIVVEPGGFSQGGDSGSLIVTYDPDNANEKKPVGLLFAGSSTHTIANPIDLVLDRFGVTIDDGSGGGTNSPPVADFTYTTSDLTANFTDQSDDLDGTIVSWSWAFGDDATSTEQNPSHPYAADGTYTVTLTVTDNDGATDSVSEDVAVSSGGGSGGTMHVSAIDMDYSTAGPNRFIYTWVTIVDESGPVSDATVYLKTTLPDSTVSVSGLTGSDGTVTFKLKSRQSGTYTSEVTDVTHASLTYDSSLNVETSDTLVVP